MNWEEGYDCGYYEGLRNALRYIAMNPHIDFNQVLVGLREMRDDALAQHQENLGDDD